MIFAFLLTQIIYSQVNKEVLIIGKIIADSSSVDRVNIINLRSSKTTVSDKSGCFKILGMPDDILVLSAINLETRRHTISVQDIEKATVLLKMNPKINNLKEVIVKENSISAQSLGIIPYGQKHYTPAQRKLYTAQTGLLDPLLNKISGRTKMLKKEVQVERNEKLLVKFDGLFEDEFYTETLLVPSDYIRGFQYYLIEDSDFVNALNSKNKTMITYFIKKLALNYNELTKQ